MTQAGKASAAAVQPPVQPPAQSSAPAGAAPATRQEMMRALLGGVADDLAGYRELGFLLNEQFDAALRHRAARLGEVAEAISALVDRMQERRQQRETLVHSLLGAGGNMKQAFALLKNAARERMEADWSTLEQLVTECKRLGKRNSDLLVEQYSIMQRVLHGEEQIYAPA